jgi:Holliday junction resolvase RusA-like endonuclease
MNEAVIQFKVSGIPGTAGSKKFVGIGKNTGRAIIIDASGKKGKDWRNLVASTAQDAFTEPMHGPLRLDVHFVLPYRKLDLDKNGIPKKTAPFWHVTKPDTTKMLRAIEDAIKGIAWIDDSQVASQYATKTYGQTPGATVTVTKILAMSEEESPDHDTGDFDPYTSRI